VRLVKGNHIIVPKSWPGQYAYPAHARAAGRSSIVREPMSIGRQSGETIAACMDLQKRLTAVNFSIPIRMMADIDPGGAARKGQRDQRGGRGTQSRRPVTQICDRLLILDRDHAR
jgi:hypothetical protein